MNVSRLYYQYFTAAARDTRLKFIDILKQAGDIPKHATIEWLQCMDMKVINAAYGYLLGFYKIVSDRQYEFFSNDVTNEEKLQHICDIINSHIYIYFPVENDYNIVDKVVGVEEKYKPVYGPVRYKSVDGRIITTKKNVRIAPVYVMLLNKIVDDCSAVASCRLHHFGIPSNVTKSEKYTSQVRPSPVRTEGETERRIYASYCGPKAVAEMANRNNSPLAHKHIYWKILDAPQPTNIDKVIDRTQIPYGNHKALQLVRHITNTAGFDIVYEPEDESKEVVDPFSVSK
jgi:hypothetical protein